MLSVFICQALVLVLPLGNIMLSVFICQALVLVLPWLGLDMNTDNIMLPKDKTKTRAWHMNTDNIMLPKGMTKTRAWHMNTDNIMLPKGKTKTRGSTVWEITKLEDEKNNEILKKNVSCLD
jgi:hypothetical protein